ncbi:protein-tyrosine phosphatase family protein [Microbacterium sp. F2]|uniref:protein-tyrosine phosphatase family protein n=1 Tax=Microbacterium sp. F2 TaxID=3422228 RepID=UPI003FD63B8F
MTETTVPIVRANVSRLTASLWIGGDLDTRRLTMARAQLAELTAAGIDTIIDCRAEWDDADWVTEENPQIDYLWIGVDDAGQRMPYDWFDDGTAYALEQIAGGHVVLSHCHMGINRGPSMGFAILLTLGWDPIEALGLIRRERPTGGAHSFREGPDDEAPRDPTGRIPRQRTSALDTCARRSALSGGPSIF